ncbi:MAG TPA: hypothetical protein VG838_06205 [Opitutaceae bacterium]|nr:hypothetical protein [Opitutaceae bacterium]
MTQRVLVAVLTVLVFASGFAARVWTESSSAVPPPPASLGSEFTPTAPLAAPPASAAKRPPVDRAQLIADIQKLGPQITMFRERMAEIDAGFEREFSAILSEEQRQHRAEAILASQKKHAAEHDAKYPPGMAHNGPMSDDEILSRQRLPLYTILQWVTVSAKLDSMTKENKLDASQQAKARSLIEDRRTKFLALVDAVTPPSILYSRLAPDVQRLAEPDK